MTDVEPKPIVANLVKQFESSTISTPLIAAKVGLEMVRSVIANEPWELAKDLLTIFGLFSSELLLRKDTFAPFVRNVILRCLKVIRDDYKAVEDMRKDSEDGYEDTERAVLGWDVKPTYDEPFVELKGRLMDNLDEVFSEIEASAANIGNQAGQHLHSNDVIMTVGYSSLVENFLKVAWKGGRSFHVVVVEGGREKPGHRTAQSLQADGIEVTLVPDSSVFAVMSNVNKVVLGTHLLLANGGLKASAGTHSVCLAASHYAVPVLVCASSYELVPEYPGFAESMSFNGSERPNFASGAEPYGYTEETTAPIFLNPLYDYVPPDMVSILLFSSGGNVPSYMYSLRNELYSPEDIAWDVNPECGDPSFL